MNFLDYLYPMTKVSWQVCIILGRSLISPVGSEIMRGQNTLDRKKMRGSKYTCSHQRAYKYWWKINLVRKCVSHFDRQCIRSGAISIKVWRRRTRNKCITRTAVDTGGQKGLRYNNGVRKRVERRVPRNLYPRIPNQLYCDVFKRE